MPVDLGGPYRPDWWAKWYLELRVRRHESVCWLFHELWVVPEEVSEVQWFSMPRERTEVRAWLGHVPPSVVVVAAVVDVLDVLDVL